MSKLVPAAQQLIEEVTRINQKMSAKIGDPPDGLGRHRAVEFDPATSKWLAPALNVIADKRIASVDTSGKQTVVNFVADTRADHRDSFGLREVKAVLDGDA